MLVYQRVTPELIINQHGLKKTTQFFAKSDPPDLLRMKHPPGLVDHVFRK